MNITSQYIKAENTKYVHCKQWTRQRVSSVASSEYAHIMMAERPKYVEIITVYCTHREVVLTEINATGCTTKHEATGQCL
jgi:hypothetical protein